MISCPLSVSILLCPLFVTNSGVDSKIRFTIEPLPGDDAFDQWRDAMKAVAGVSMGIPDDYRKKVIHITSLP